MPMRLSREVAGMVATQTRAVEQPSEERHGGWPARGEFLAYFVVSAVLRVRKSVVLTLLRHVVLILISLSF